MTRRHGRWFGWAQGAGGGDARALHLAPAGLAVVLAGALMASACGGGAGAASDATITPVDATIAEVDAGAGDTLAETLGDTPGDVPPDAAAPDGGPQDAVTPDATGVDWFVPDVVPEPGEFLAPCDTNEDCYSGFCVDSPQGKVCTRTCTETCPHPAWACRQDLGALPDVLYVCQPKFPTLCYPCRTNEECASPLDSTPHRCVPLGDQGAFCGGDCDDLGCPPGYFCGTVADVDGSSSRQCMPQDGACACSPGALGRATGCAVSNPEGVCGGERACTEDGLSACDAPTPAPDDCDGLDNDCDGQTDDGFAPSACERSNDFGTCPGQTSCAGADGESCDAPEPAAEACDGLDDDCDGQTDEADAQGCTTYFMDADGDGHGDPDVSACLCAPEGSFTAAQADADDCDDSAGQLHPGALERCDGLDDDCDGVTDALPAGAAEPGEGPAGCVVFYADQDGDGFGDAADSACLCLPAAPYTTTDHSDCDDGASAVSPAASESCAGAGVDEDCDGQTDEAGAAGCTLLFADADADGYGDQGDFACLCAPAAPYVVTQGGDCDDDATAVNPGLAEGCGDAVDNDCDGLTDEQGAQGCTDFYLDADRDGYGVAGDSRCLCAAAEPYDALAAQATDCDDGDDAVHPGADEICNQGVDDNCDGFADEPGAQGCVVRYRDQDLDGHGVPGDSACLCAPAAPFVAETDDDCDDANPAIYTGATEVCNGLDDDCNGQTDEGVVGSCTDFYQDADKDGWGAGQPVCLCSPDGDYTTSKGGDCRDDDATAFPGAQELCNGVDDDCDGQTDEAGALGCALYFRDHDGDGFGLTTDKRCLCAPQDDYTSQAPGDCDDDDDAVLLGAAEVCGDAVDNDCDGATDEAGAQGCTALLRDEDDDGFGVTGDAQCLCAPSSTFKVPAGTGHGGDCDDGEPLAHPGGDEVCDGVDNDCNGAVDDPGADGLIDGCAPRFLDVDGDGFGVDGDSLCLCGPLGTYTALQGGDCDDHVATSNPDAPERCNGGTDDDCDGQTDEPGAAGCVSFLLDGDGDGFGVTGDTACLCAPDAQHRAQLGGDCDDGDPTIFPGAVEVCTPGAPPATPVDDYCDGVADPPGAAGCVVSYADADGDGFGDPTAQACLCQPTAAYPVTQAGDCDDSNNAVLPGAVETCATPADDDCNGVVNDPGAQGCTVFLADADGDGYGVDSDSRCLCAATGIYTAPAAQGGDCDDGLGTVNPGAAERCNNVDDDCDGATDEVGALGCADYLRDEDGDSFGVTGDSQCLCAAGPVYRATVGGDCADTDAAVSPGAAEVCDPGQPVDNDCDGQTDGAGAGGCAVYFHDGDGDTFGDPTQSQCLRAPGGGFTVTQAGDCDDADADARPNVVEQCGDGVDNDCDGFTDEEGAQGCVVLHEDADGDGHGVANAKCLCAPLGAFSAASQDDCDDANPLRYPGRPETCNGVDDNCADGADEPGAQGCTSYLMDADRDGYGVDGSATCLCAPVGDQDATVGGDCDDGAPAVSPAASEVCDAIDNQCDGVVDEDCGLPTVGWPTYKLDARRTGHTMLYEAPQSPTLRWSTALPGGGAVRSSPVISPSGADAYVTLGSSVYRLDVASGALTAQRDLGDAVYDYAGPTLRDGGTVVVPHGSSLTMLTPDLQVIWTTALGSPVVSTPIVDPNGVIYVVSAAALHRVGVDGVEDWSEPIDNDADTPSHPAIGINGRVYFTTSSHKVYAIDPAAPAGSRVVFATVPAGVPGAELLQPVDGSVVVSELSYLYVAYGDTLYGLTIAGTTQYTQSLSQRTRAGLAIHNTGYVCCNPVEYLWTSLAGNRPMSRHNVDLTPVSTTGNVPKSSTARTPAPVFDRDGDVLVGSSANALRAFTQAGSNKWTFATSAPVEGPAAVGDGVVIFGDTAGHVLCVEE